MRPTIDRRTNIDISCDIRIIVETWNIVSDNDRSVFYETYAKLEENNGFNVWKKVERLLVNESGDISLISHDEKESRADHDNVVNSMKIMYVLSVPDDAI